MKRGDPMIQHLLLSIKKNHTILVNIGDKFNPFNLQESLGGLEYSFKKKKEHNLFQNVFSQNNCSKLLESVFSWHKNRKTGSNVSLKILLRHAKFNSNFM